MGCAACWRLRGEVMVQLLPVSRGGSKEFESGRKSDRMLSALHSEHWRLWALLAQNIKSSPANSAACAELSCLFMLLQMRGKLPG